MSKQTDNSNTASKLLLRRYYLDRYHQHGGLVFDCCQAEQHLWSILRQEYPQMRYFGVDLKPKPGRLVVDSTRLIGSIPNIDVYDVDTYGDPMAQLERICQTLNRPTTVFLTWGYSAAGGGINLTKAAFRACKIPKDTPKSLLLRYLPTIQKICCSVPLQYDIIMSDVMEAPRAKNCCYFGMRLEPRK